MINLKLQKPLNSTTAITKPQQTFDDEANAEDVLFYQQLSPIDDEEPLLGRMLVDENSNDEELSDIVDEDDHTLRRKLYTGIKSYRGLLYMVFASLFFALMNLAVKVMSTSETEKLNPFEIIFLRSALVYFMTVGAMKIMNIADPWFGPRDLRFKLILRGMLGWGTLACGYYALTLMSLGDATVVGFLSPTLTGFLAFILLGERWNLIDAGASIFSLLGVVFIARPAFLFGDRSSNNTVPSTKSDLESNDHSLGVTFSLLGAAFSSFAFIALRSLSRRISILHSVSSLSYVGMSLSLLSWPILSIFTSYPQKWLFPLTSATYFWLFIVGLCGFFGQLLVSRAVQLETAAKAATISYTQVLFAFVFEWAYFKSVPNLWSLAGAFVIGSSVIFVAVAKVAGSTASAAAASGGLEGAEGALYEQQAGANGDLEIEVLPFASNTEVPANNYDADFEWDWRQYIEWVENLGTSIRSLFNRQRYQYRYRST
ncbi:hypothetical protein HK098_001479 [Nowakowskiella sp. JEL0407]|nr:hypothetical protein HK098_001479 [Nowakowskiella sp. JEL0407]